MAEYDDYITIDNAVNCASAVLGLSDTQKSAVQRYMRTIPAVRTPKYDPDEFFHHKRKTHYDEIRSMTMEVLAEFLCFVEHRYSEFDRRTWLDWLQQEVDT